MSARIKFLTLAVLLLAALATVRIHFNAGDHAISLGVPYPEYIRVDSPTLGVFAVPVPGTS